MADKLIDARVLARRQQDVEGFTEKYQDIIDARLQKYGKEIAPIWYRAAQRIEHRIKKLILEIEAGKGVLPDYKLTALQNKARRLDSLYGEIRTLIGETQAPLNQKLGRRLAYTYTEAYYHHAWGLEQGLKLTISVPLLTYNQVLGVLNNPWLGDGKTYSNRIRANTAYLAEKMVNSIGRAVTESWGWNETARYIQHTALEGYHNSVRLARTEMGRAAAQGATQLYMENADVLDGKRWNATLDRRTAPKDAANDGKLYPLEYDTPEMPGKPGERIPNHPNCRCRWSPVLSALGVSTKERMAREGDGLDNYGKRVYTEARTYRDYAKERGLPDLDEQLAKDDPRKYLRRGETIKDYNLGNSIGLLSLTQRDITSITAFENYLGTADTTNRQALAEKLLVDAELGHIQVAVSNINANGYCKIPINADGTQNVTDFVLKRDDVRPYEYQVKTVLHEFYHAKGHGLFQDRNAVGMDKWTRFEETAAETVAQYLLKTAGVKKEIGFSYSQYLVENLPRLKKLEEFADCKTVTDFGRSFMRYRFSENHNTAEWGSLASRVEAVTFDLEEYAKQYENYVMNHQDEILELLYDSVQDQNKLTDKAGYIATIKRSFEAGWKNKKDTFGPAFSDSLIIAMNRLGVK